MTLMQSQRFKALLETVFFITMTIGLKEALDPFAWRFAGPISLVTTVALLTIYLRKKGISWSDLGLLRLKGKRAKLMLIPQMLLTFAGFAMVIMLMEYGAPALGYDFMNEVPAGVEDRFGGVRGNLPILLLWLAIIWSAAAFGEEMFFRGFLMSQIEQIFDNIPGKAILMVVLPAILFGALHYYNQGIRGALTAGGIGLVFGTLFLLYKRNLWPLILFHGAIDTMGMVALYLNLK